MIRKYHNHKLQTTLWHREEQPLNHHKTPGRQIKQSNQLSLPHQDDYTSCTQAHDVMQANPDKFQTIKLGKSGFENCKSLFLNGTEIKCELRLCKTPNICIKAVRQINVLLRLSKFLTIEAKNVIYKSFIRSNFN